MKRQGPAKMGRCRDHEVPNDSFELFTVDFYLIRCRECLLCHKKCTIDGVVTFNQPYNRNNRYIGYGCDFYELVFDNFML
jgi:hypothetical protein